MTASSNKAIKTNGVKANKTVRKYRPRRELPEDLTNFYLAEGEYPSDLDVVGGRGGISNYHEGNKRYWRYVLAKRPGYKKLGKNDMAKKNEIAEGIYDYILSTGGRFLQLDAKTQRWFNLPQKIGLDKVKQALRDKYVPNFLDREQISVLPLATLRASAEGQNDQSWASENHAPVIPQFDFITDIELDPAILIETSSNLDSLNSVSDPSLDQMEEEWALFATESEMQDFESSLCRHSLDDWMRDDAIAAFDEMTQDDSASTVVQAPETL